MKKTNHNHWVGIIANLLAITLISFTLLLTFHQMRRSDESVISILSFISLSGLEVSQLVMLLPWGLWRKDLVAANYSFIGIVSSFLRVLFPYVWSAVGVVFTTNSYTSSLFPVMGFIVQTISQAFAIWAVLTLRSSFSVLPEAHSIVTTGPYRYVRHPIYTAYMFIMLSRWLQAPSWFSFMGCILLTLLFTISAALEEKELSHLKGFNFYHQNTPAFIHFIGT